MGIFSRNKDIAEQKDETATKDSKKSVSVGNDKKKTEVKMEKKVKEIEKETVKKTSSKNIRTSKAYEILVKPLITEKATQLGAQNKYVFEVSKSANKIEIAKSINDVYGVKPVSVNILNFDGKRIRRGRTTGRRKDWKKAIVKLPKDKTINVYEGV